MNLIVKFYTKNIYYYFKFFAILRFIIDKQTPCFNPIINILYPNLLSRLLVNSLFSLDICPFIKS